MGGISQGREIKSSHSFIRLFYHIVLVGRSVSLALALSEAVNRRTIRTTIWLGVVVGNGEYTDRHGGGGDYET